MLAGLISPPVRLVGCSRWAALRSAWVPQLALHPLHSSPAPPPASSRRSFSSVLTASPRPPPLQQRVLATPLSSPLPARSPWAPPLRFSLGRRRPAPILEVTNLPAGKDKIFQ
ncbi:hypothetical protein PVAP13_1KG017200 [Panicum virgatum]|uniref:Uncharacterized protein n=1 Tax=Panicum virgatum TaxID=38727 RepID=A0A8T0X974_PANVG|nr:hypothetical protein PVAP13_1KG017200 [Panicum virgatum]